MKPRYLYYAVGEGLVRTLPRSVSIFLSRALAWAYHRFFFAKDRAALRGNLEAAGGEASELIANFARYFLDLFYSRRLSKKFIQNHVEIRGLPFLERALAGKKGVILASAHVGNWELGGMVLAKLGFPVTGVALRHGDPKIEKLFQRRRQKNGLDVIYLGNSLRKCYNVLKENKILVLNADRAFTGRTVPVLFLGREVNFPAGIARFRRATGAEILPCFFVMKDSARYFLDIEPPLAALDERGTVQSFATRLEQRIKQCPTQWFVFRPYWETPNLPA
ncbi:MAG: lysophospholipid acyltransferase family protein [Candidatus Omnitrophica bacterium]|nr:lysophospholipid acyltransferase family protein [Candidatus Omnitrophota bacterium]